MSNNNSDIKKMDLSGGRSRSAFTLIEVITALFIIMVGIFSGYALVTQTISSAREISTQLTAAYLGKEGIEIVKNIRDSNYLKIHFSADEGAANWTNGLASDGFPTAIDCSSDNGSNGCVADYNSGELALNNDQPLKYSPDTGFGYASGDATIYKRTIKVDPNAADGLLAVSVVVTWTEKGANHTTNVNVDENLYDWWPHPED